jgi:hypothetical protein
LFKNQFDFSKFGAIAHKFMDKCPPEGEPGESKGAQAVNKNAPLFSERGANKQN